MKNRSGKQVRERYINKLDPLINKESFSESEDKKIIQLYHSIGPRWSEISKFLNGRPENMVKNRFYSHIKKHYDIEKNELKPGSKKMKKRLLDKRKTELVKRKNDKMHGPFKKKKTKREISKKKFLQAQ